MSKRVKKARFLSFFKLLVFLVLSITNPKPPWMMSLSANDRPFLNSFCRVPPQESFVQFWPPGRKAYLVKIGLKSFVDGRQDICKDKESNLGSVVGY